jgi:hypothetical protein
LGIQYIFSEECTMKKLSVVLLATVFVFGLVFQVNAQVTDGVDAGDQLITFNDIAAGTPVGDYYLGYGVSFSDTLYGERSELGAHYFNSLEPVSNFKVFPWMDENGEIIPGEPVIVTFDPPVTHVGFIGFSPDGGITVTPFRGQVAGNPAYFETLSGTEPTSISIADPLGIDMVQIEGDGYIAGKQFIFWMDDFTFGGTPDTGPTDIEVTMNVNPPSCSGASINVKSKGVTPVVIPGSATFDVTMINPDSIQLHGVAPVRSALEDVPYCSKLDPDGFLDLTLKFDTKKLVDAMEASALAEGVTLENDDWPVLHLTGSLFDGTTFYADEPVSVKGKPAKENNRKGNKRSFDPHARHDRGHHHGWDKDHGKHKNR